MTEQLTIDFPAAPPAEDSTGRFAPYPFYRTSRVPNIAKVPSHWTEKPLKCVTAINRRKLDDCADSNYELEYIDIGNVDMVQGVQFTEKLRFEDAPSRARRRVVNGDTIISTVRTYLKAVARIVDPPDNLIASTGFAVLTPTRHIDPDFLYRLVQSEPFIHEVVARSVGVSYPAINASELGHFLVPLPPLGEQQALAAFLDHETARIDGLIADKAQLIALLAEKRAAVVTQAVTKGLDPNAKLKPSGIDWLGRIPSHWLLKKLKYVSHLQTGVTLGKKYDDERRVTLVTRPYLRVANVQDGWLDLDEITEVSVPPDAVPRYELQAGDVLMTEGGDFDKLGRGYVWEGQIPGCLHQNHIFALRPQKRFLDSHLLAALMSSHHGRNYFTKTSQQTTNLASTNSTKLGEFPLPLPPLDEQRRIVQFIVEFGERLDRLSREVSTAIDRLREYRSALITAAVTGRIDVRNQSGEP